MQKKCENKFLIFIIKLFLASHVFLAVQHLGHQKIGSSWSWMLWCNI